MKVELISHTPNALALLLYTKDTRLKAGETMDSIQVWPMEKKLEHLEYMRNTIKSSWEFVDYTFEITDVSRVFTHQLVRTRHGSYAQQSQRTVKADGVVVPKGMENPVLYLDTADEIFEEYNHAIDNGEEIQNARYILPVGTATNIIAKFNLRTLHDMANVRLCVRTGGEYQDVFKAMKVAVLEVHPWADKFIQVACVNTGVCIFPNYTECPVQRYTIKPNELEARTIKRVWEETDHVANPVVKVGKTM